MSEATIHRLRPSLKPFSASEFWIACQTYFPPEIQMRAMACYVGLCATERIDAAIFELQEIRREAGRSMVCVCCGEDYQAQRPPQYCSAACRKRAWRERKKSEAQS